MLTNMYMPLVAGNDLHSPRGNTAQTERNLEEANKVAAHSQVVVLMSAPGKLQSDC